MSTHVMGEILPLFKTTLNKSLSIEFRPERLTGEPGAVILREIMERLKIIGWIAEWVDNLRKPGLITHPLAELLMMPPCALLRAMRAEQRRWKVASIWPRSRCCHV
jgi:hypothetical protein